MFKRSQTSIEFMVIFVFIIGLMSLFMVIIGVYTQDLTNTESKLEIDNFANSITSEFELLSNVEGGFNREVIIPSNLLEKYNVTIIDNYLVIEDLFAGGNSDDTSYFYELSGKYDYVVSSESNGDLKISLSTQDINNFDSLNLDTPDPPFSEVWFLSDGNITNTTTISYMQDFILNWSSSNIPSTCIASVDWGGIKNPSGNELIEDSKVNKIFTLDCEGISNDATASFNLLVDAPLGSTLTFYSTPSVIPYNTSTNLSWQAQNMYDITNCYASGNWSGTKNISGLESTGDLISNKTYTLTCNAPAGTVIETAFVEVLPLPEITFTADSNSLSLGESVNLSWDVNYANLCIASGNWSGEKNITGTFNAGNLNTPGTYTYTLECSGPGGNNSKFIEILVCAEGQRVENNVCIEDILIYYFYNTNSLQYLSIPQGIKSATFKVWGAGGARGSYLQSGNGGGGGFVSGSYIVNEGDQFEILVGAGGISYSTTPSYGEGYGGGASGLGGGAAGPGGQGGGASYVKKITSNNPELVAGGGGGGGSSMNDPGYDANPGGVGGGMSGNQGGQGASSCAPYGGYFGGGGRVSGGGGGGGGYKGGTGGGLNGPSCGDWVEGYGGNGGLNYVNTINSYIENGNGMYPGNSNDLYWKESLGYGGNKTVSSGMDGYVVVILEGYKEEELEINSNIFNYNVANELGNPWQPVNVLVTINSDIIVGSTSTSTPAFSTGNLPEGSTVTLINNGRIQGAGGNGGLGGSGWFRNGEYGGNGGNALEANSILIIDNLNGEIWSGGGGGAGGLSGGDHYGIQPGGGSGGGGAGSFAGSGGSSSWYQGRIGIDGTSEIGGLGGSGFQYGAASSSGGGSGGGPGQNGGAAAGCYNLAIGGSCNYDPTEGGLAGYAITGWDKVTLLGEVGDIRGREGEVLLSDGLSCKDILDSGNSNGDGIYTIDPDGYVGNPPFEVYCDMTTDGGGWTMIMKFQPGSTSLGYSSSYWTNANELNDNDLDVTIDIDAKYRSFSELSGTSLMYKEYDSSTYQKFNFGSSYTAQDIFTNSRGYSSRTGNYWGNSANNGGHCSNPSYVNGRAQSHGVNLLGVADLGYSWQYSFRMRLGHYYESSYDGSADNYGHCGWGLGFSTTSQGVSSGCYNKGTCNEAKVRLFIR